MNNQSTEENAKRLSHSRLIIQELEKRILVIVGDMGKMIQRYRLDEDGYRGERFKDF